MRIARLTTIAALTCIAGSTAAWIGCSSDPSSSAAPTANVPSAPPSSTAPAPPAPPPPTPPCSDVERASLAIDWSHNRIKPTSHRVPKRWSAISACPPGSDAGAPPPNGDDGGATNGDAGPTGGDDGGGIDGGAPSFDWNFIAEGPVNAAAAMVIPSFPASSPSDAIFFAAKSGFPNVYKLTGIYSTGPGVGWSALTAGVDGSALALSVDGSEVFAVDQSGTVYCFTAASGAVCSGWSSQSTSFGRTVSRSSPWIDYSTGVLYFADLGGYLDKLNTANGQVVWSVQVSTTSIHASPIEESGYVYLGDDGGTIYRVLDPGSSAPTGGDVSSYSICAPSCSSSALVSGPTLDLSSSTAYFVGGGAIEEFALGAGTWAPTARLSFNMPAGIDESSPVLDGAGSLYVGFSNAVFRAPYPLSSAQPPVGALLYGQGSPSTSPDSTPLVWQGHVYIGDGAGMTEDYTCLTRAGAPALAAVTTAYGTSVDSEPLIDYGTGNVIFGYTGAGSTGGIVQITQAGGWGCGTQAACATVCGTASVCEPATGCVPDMVPPSTFWLSGGGGPALSGAWNGAFPSLEWTMGGSLFAAPASNDAGAAWFPSGLSSEGF